MSLTSSLVDKYRDVVIKSESRGKVIREMEKYILEESDTYLRYTGKIPEGVSIYYDENRIAEISNSTFTALKLA